MARADDVSYSESRRNFLRGKMATSPSTAAPGAPRLARVGATCLASHNIVCRACGDLCAAAAIRFRPRLGGASLPEVSPRACTGCGECMAACPTNAISMVYGHQEALASHPAHVHSLNPQGRALTTYEDARKEAT